MGRRLLEKPGHSPGLPSGTPTVQMPAMPRLDARIFFVYPSPFGYSTIGPEFFRVSILNACQIYTTPRG